MMRVPQLLDTSANRATFPAAVMAHADQGGAGRLHIVAIRQPAGF